MHSFPTVQATRQATSQGAVHFLFANPAPVTHTCSFTQPPHKILSCQILSPQTLSSSDHIQAIFFSYFFSSYRDLAATQTKPYTFTPCTTRPCPARFCFHQISGLPDKAALLPVRLEPHPPNSPCKHPCLFHLFSSSFPQTPRGLPFVPCAASSPRLAWPRPARPSLTVPCSRHRGDALIAQSLDNISSLPFR